MAEIQTATYTFVMPEKKYGVKAAFHSIDFARSDDAAYNLLTAAVKDLDVGVLSESAIIYSAL